MCLVEDVEQTDENFEDVSQIVAEEETEGLSLEDVVGPKLKFYLFPLTRSALKKGPTQKNLFQFSGVIKFRINQDFLIEHSCILHIRSNLLLL